MGSTIGAASAETLAKEITEVAPAYRGVTWDLLDWGEGREGVVVPPAEGSQPLAFIPVDPGFEAVAGSGLALHLGRVLYDDGVRVRLSMSLPKLAPEPAAHLNPDDAGRLGLVEGRPVRVSDGRDSIEVEVRLDPSLAKGTVYVPFNLAATAGLAARPEVKVEAVG